MAECAENNLTRVAEGAEEEDCEAKCEQFNTEDKLGFWVWFMIIVGSAMVFSLLIWWGCSPKKHTAHSNEQPLLDNEHYPSGYMAHPSKVDSDSDDYNPLYQPHLYN